MSYRNGQTLPLEGGHALRLRVNPKARRVSIRIDAKTRQAIAIAPDERRLTQAVAFARDRTDWIADHLARTTAPVPLAPGLTLTVEGRSVRLEATGDGRSAHWAGTAEAPVIRSGGEGEAFAHRVENLLRQLARRRLEARTHHHLDTLGQGPVRLSVVDTRSRWGSCSPHNRSIRYSWRVILAPGPVLDYLAAHEVAHLVHADHSPAFWSVVRDLIGDPTPHRAWLRTHGTALHAVGA